MTREAERRAAERERYRTLDAIGAEWDRRNPDACPDCKCRPGKGDAEDASDHETWCRARVLGDL